MAGDLVYLSTQNLKLPKFRSCKLSPKYVVPYKILTDYGYGSFKLELPSELKQRGTHAAFHASLLRIHVHNGDRCFPGHQLHHLLDFGEPPKEWEVA